MQRRHSTLHIPFILHNLREKQSENEGKPRVFRSFALRVKIYGQ